MPGIGILMTDCWPAGRKSIPMPLVTSEKYINQKQMGRITPRKILPAHYKTPSPHLIEQARERCKVAFEWVKLDVESAPGRSRPLHLPGDEDGRDRRRHLVPESALPDFVHRYERPQGAQCSSVATIWAKPCFIPRPVKWTLSGYRARPTGEYVERRSRCLACAINWLRAR